MTELEELAALLEQAELLGLTRPRFSAASIAAGHAPQLELMTALERLVLALCSRRAGKSSGICGLLGLDGARVPETQIYFGPTKPAVRLSIWEKIWIPFCSSWSLPVDHNDTRMVSKFDGGGIIAFTGTDDIRHVETYLGNRLWRAVIDEAQSQPDSVLVPLVTRILPPALSDAGLLGQLILAGTIPEVPAGLFFRLWSEAKGWRKLNWSRFENPHMGSRETQLQRLREYVETAGVTEEDPIVQRDWFGRFVFDPNATAYRYLRERNGYDPVRPAWADSIDVPSGAIVASEPWLGVDTFACAIDPGSRDRVSVQVWGWGRSSNEVQHVFDWTSARNARLTWGQIAPVLGLIAARLAPSRWFYDAGSSQNELDTFWTDFRVPVIRAAAKADMPGQVRRMNSMLQAGRAKVMIGSPLAEDLEKARWDPDARARGQWHWSSAWHPDASEAARYALAGYFEQRPSEDAAAPVPEERRGFEDETARPWFERDLAALGIGGGGGLTY